MDWAQAAADVQPFLEPAAGVDLLTAENLRRVLERVPEADVDAMERNLRRVAPAVLGSLGELWLHPELGVVGVKIPLLGMERANLAALQAQLAGVEQSLADLG